MRRLVLLAVILSSLVFGLAATAQDKASVSLRANVQDGFIRLVFSGAKLPQATVSGSGQNLNVIFAAPVSIADAAAAAAGITPATSISVGEDGKSVSITTGAMARHRTLALGNRLFVDIFTTAKPAESAAAKPAPAATETAKVETPKVEAPKAETPKVETPKTEAPKPAEKAAALNVEPAKTEAVKTPAPVAVTKTPAVTGSLVAEDAQAMPKALAALDAQQKNIIVTTSPPEAGVSAPAAATLPPAPQDTAPILPGAAAALLEPEPAPEPVKPFTGQAVITIGSTQGLAMAAFVRQGYLWIVLSQEKLSVPPQVSGPNASALGPVDAVSIDGGSAFRIKIPAGAYVRPEGGGLVWRLYVQGQNPNLRSVDPDRDFADTATGPIVRIPLRNASSALRLPDPLVGDDLAVVTVGRAESRLTDDSSYVDFDTIPAIVGAVLRPKADGLRIAVLPIEVTVARQGGLRITAEGPRGVAKPAGVRLSEGTKDSAPTVLFDFKNWGLGGPKQYLDMRRSIDDKVASAPEDRKLPEILNGAKFMLAQGLPEEATGFVQMAQGYMPALADSGDFQALSGAVHALRGETDDALAAFATPSLQALDETGLWRAYTLARAGNMTDAEKAVTPAGLAILGGYPARLQTQMLPPLIEAELARGDVAQADALIEAFDKASENALVSDRDMVVSYFKGRSAQLRGEADQAAENFRNAAEGTFGPYPVRATLALVERGLSSKTISRDDAIRKLERFRYGWRGDALETDILVRLGMIYVTGGEQRRGLTILRNAATMTADPVERDKIVAVMQKAFKELYAGQTKEKMTPIDAATLAADFAELMPAGGEGEAITMTIADQMVAIDLLDRAGDMIEPMVGTTANIKDALRYAERGAAIRILNDQPDQALRVLDKALARPDAVGNVPAEDVRRVALLRAKAKAEMKRVDEAMAELAALPEDTEVLSLQADIAWNAQRWSAAADAFDKLVKSANLNATRAPTLEQAQLVLNEALALNLSGDTERLETLRLSYGDIMRRSDLSQPFQLVTRTAQAATLADRDTLLKLVSEVDLFRDVLERYKTNDLSKPKAAARPADQKPAEAPAPAAPAAQEPAKTNG